MGRYDEAASGGLPGFRKGRIRNSCQVGGSRPVFQIEFKMERREGREGGGKVFDHIIGNGVLAGSSGG